jgi:cold shock CspA family protein
MEYKYTILKEGQRVCVEVEDSSKGSPLSYPKYLFSVLAESGFGYVSDSLETGIEFAHYQDTNLRVILTLDKGHNWHHLIAYKHSKWTLTYEGDVKCHECGNRVLHTIRQAHKHWFKG